MGAELKAVLFDMGGTLMEYPAPSMRRIGDNRAEEIAKEIGVEKDVVLRFSRIYNAARRISFETLKEASAVDCFDKALREVSGAQKPSDVEEITARLYTSHFSRAARPVDGAEEVLAHIKGQGLKMAIVSNITYPGGFVENDLKRFGLFGYFDVLIWSHDVGFRKPHPVIFTRALDYLGIEAEEAIFVGNEFEKDIEGPNGLNMPAIWISSEKKPREFVGSQVKELKEVTRTIFLSRN